MNLFSTFLFILFSTVSLVAQNEKGHFLVEFDAFSPPTKELIASFENAQASPFLAPDIFGKEQFLGDYAGKKVLLWFWSTADDISNNQLSHLNLIQSRHRADVQVLSFADEQKQELIDYTKSIPIDFPVIANGKILGEAAFGGDLGQGRIFILTDTGMIHKVLPRTIFEENQADAFRVIEEILQSI